MHHWVALALALALAACGDTRIDVADKIAAHAIGLARSTVGGGKFATVEYEPKVSERDRCDALMQYARDTFKDPPDCVRIRCRFQDESTDLLVSYDGSWHQGGGLYPRCGK